MQHTKRADPSVSWVCWRAPGCPAIAFRRQVLDGINAEVIHAMNAVPRRGAEAGGLLLGSRTDSEITIEDFEPVPCEHRFGPSYRLSKTDLQALDETLLWFREQARHGLSVVGSYRSHTRPEFTLAPEDHRVFATYFAGPEQVLLLIKPSRLQQTVADFFLWRNGRLEEAALPVPFPFRGATGAPARIEPAPSPAPLPERIRPEPPAPAVLFEPPSAAPSKPVRRSYMLWGIAALLSAAMGAVLGYLSLDTPPAARAVARTRAQRTSVIQPAASTNPPVAPSLEKPPVPVKPPVPPARLHPKPVESESPRAGVEHVLRRWADDIRRGNVEGAASHYAPRITSYFGKSNATPADVRRSLHASLARYGRLSVNRIVDLNVVPRGRGDAVATFRSHWETGGGWKHAAEQAERLHLVLTRSGWKIASENSVRTYWSYRVR